METGKTLRTLRARRRARGFTLLELAMVVGLGAVIVAGVMMFFGTASIGQKTEDTMSEVGDIEQAVHSLYAGQTSYNNLSASVIAASNQFPSKWVLGGNQGDGSGGTPTGLSSPFGGTTTVSPVTDAGGSTNADFSIQITNLPAQACTRIATMDLGTGVVSMTVNGATPVAERAMNPVEATTACAGKNTSAITWTLF